MFSEIKDTRAMVNCVTFTYLSNDHWSLDEEKRLVLQNARNTPHYANIETFAFNDFINYVMNYGKEKKEN